MPTVVQQDLIAELKRADIEAPVRKLYDSFFEAVVTHVLMNGGSRDDGADIFQEAILVLIDKVKTGQFRGDSSIKTFLLAISRNLWLHELRTRSRRNNREVIYMSGEEKEIAPRESFFEKDNTRALEQLLDQVGDPCKKILTGFYYEDKSMKEILVDFQYENEQVLRNRKSRCMKKLKELLSANKELMQTLNPLFLYEQ
jgi:RNA polymerase sigma factor (sigma-70 family)